jgi:hypothetical protein
MTAVELATIAAGRLQEPCTDRARRTTDAVSVSVLIENSDATDIDAMVTVPAARMGCGVY